MFMNVVYRSFHPTLKDQLEAGWLVSAILIKCPS